MKNAVVAGKGWALLACLACAAVGFGAWIAMLSMGLLQTTGMSNIFNWGLLIMMFAFLVGFGAGCQLVASYMVLSGRDEYRSFIAVSQACALAGACGAGIAVIIDLGSPFHIMSMLLHPNITSPLTWDMVALTAFVIVAVICLIAIARKWKSLRVWMIVGIVAALALQVVEGLLFALQYSRAWWHSVIEPLDFLLVACVCGLALVVLICAVSKNPDGIPAARRLSSILFWAVCIHVALSLLEVLMLAMEGAPGASEALSLLGAYAWLYAIELALPLAAVVMLRIGLQNASKTKLILCSVLVIVGMFAHRLMLLYPALGGVTLFTDLSNEVSPWWSFPASTGFFASADHTFANTVMYLPAGIEWLSILLPIGAAGLIAIVAYNLATLPERQPEP